MEVLKAQDSNPWCVKDLCCKHSYFQCEGAGGARLAKNLQKTNALVIVYHDQYFFRILA